MIDKQYSPSVASAQSGKKLDALAEQFQRNIFQLPLPAPIAATGMIIEGDGTKTGLVVIAHGIVLKGRFDQVWLDNGRASKQLAGRIRFFRQSNDGRDFGEVLYQIVFDALGNSRLGEGKRFSASIIPGTEDFVNTYRSVALGLINAIHANMDSPGNGA